MRSINMKIIRDDVCYVEKEDLEFLESLPQNVINMTKWDINYSTYLNIIKISDEEAVNFFKSKNFILNYDKVKNLSFPDLNNLIIEIEKKGLEYISSFPFEENSKEFLDSFKSQELNIKLLNYLIESIKKYASNKDLYDREIYLLSFSNFKKVELEYTPSVDNSMLIKEIKDSVKTDEIKKLQL
jgi:predicted DNA binding CopG/RHH family protein